MTITEQTIADYAAKGRCPRFVFDCHDDSYSRPHGSRRDYPCTCGNCPDERYPHPHPPLVDNR